MERAAQTLEEFRVPYERCTLSSDSQRNYAKAAAPRGLKTLVVGVDRGAMVAGRLASQTSLPVIGVPLVRSHRHALKPLLLSVQNSHHGSVAMVAMNNATNAALFAVQCLAVGDPRLERALRIYKRRLAFSNRQADRQLQSS